MHGGVTTRPAPLRARARRAATPPPTLLDLASELVAAGGSDREVVAALVDLLATGRVRPAGPAGAEPPVGREGRAT